VEITKEELDKAHKDKQCKVFKENFKVVCSFQSLDSNEKVAHTEAALSELQLDEKKEATGDPQLKSASIAVITDKYPSLKTF
jgi:hypothetical protein